MDTLTPSLSVLLCCNADPTPAVLSTRNHCWIMWVWGWCNVLFNEMKTLFSRRIDNRQMRRQKHCFPYVPLLSQSPLDIWRYKVTWEVGCASAALNFAILYVTLKVNGSGEEPKRKTKHICLTDAFLPTYEVIPLHVVSKRKIYPNWGHEKCILMGCHNSHTQNEVMWWDSVRKRFVMISLCIHNAHRTVVLSGCVGAAVLMNHSVNVGLLK